MLLPTHVFGLRRAPLQIQEQRSVRAARGVLQTHHTLTQSLQRLELHYRHIPLAYERPSAPNAQLFADFCTNSCVYYTYVKHGDTCV